MSELTGFLKKVMDRLTGGDEGKILRFIKNADKLAQATIKAKNESILDIQERIKDLDDSVTEALENVDVTRLKDIDSSKAYAATYINTYMQMQEQRKAYQEQIENLQTEIELYNGFTAAIQ